MAETAGEIKPYDPTLRERLAEGLQAGLEKMGTDRYKARQRAQTVMGGPSSNLPMGLGLTDVAASVSAPAALAVSPLYASEGVRDIKEAGESAKRGDYVGAGVDLAFGAMNVAPFVSGVTNLAQRVLRRPMQPMEVPDIPLLPEDLPKRQKRHPQGLSEPEAEAARMRALDRVKRLLGEQRMAGGGAMKPFKENVKKAVREAVEKVEPMVNRISMSFKDVTKRVPELTEAAQAVSRGDMSADEYDRLVRRYKPVTPYEFVPEPASTDDAMRALTENKRPMFGKTSEMSPGERADLRLDIPAYKDHGVWVNSIHRKDAPTVYGSVSSVKNATMIGSPEKAMKVATGETPKAPFAVIRGEWNPMTEGEAVKAAKQYLNHPEWRQVGYDPERHGYFYDRATMEPILGAEEVIQIGPLVLARKPQFGKKSEQKYQLGGLALAHRR